MNFRTINAGTTVKWEIDAPDYPVNDWVFTYYIRGAKSKDIISVPVNGKHTFTINPADTLDWPAGVYKWQLVVEDSGETEKYLYSSGSVNLVAALSEADAGGIDTISKTKQILDAIDNTIKGVASKEEQTILMGIMQLQYQSLDALIKARQYYASLYAQELNQEARQQGKFGRKILTRFVRSS